MFAFFKCVAEAVVEKGAKGLAGMVPGGAFAVGVAEAAWKKYRDRKRDAELRAEIQSMANATFEQAKAAAAEAAREAMPAATPDDQFQLEMYLTQIPAAVKQSLKRPDDPTGLSVPAGFSMKSPDDVLKWLPPRVPKFRPNDPVPGKPGWVLAEQIGVGGFGEVWLAKHPKFATLVGAIKFCHDLESRDRDLMHESGVVDRVMAAGRHPNIVPLLDVNLDGDAPWLMYEYVPGGDLADLIRAWSGSSERVAKAAALLEELAAAVGHFHQLSPPVVHRDLKPSNILKDRTSGRLRITDFGISGAAARKMIEVESRGGGTRGGRLLSYLRGSYTPLYSSPQQRDGDDPDPRDDVHALGVIGYQVLTGNLNQGAGPDFADDLRDAGATEELIALLGRCVAQKADRRPKDATELAEKLRDLKPPPKTPAVVFKPAPVPGPAPDKVRMNCPACRKPMRASAALVGKAVKCPSCGQTFTGADADAPPGDKTYEVTLDVDAKTFSVAHEKPPAASRNFDVTLEGTWHARATPGGPWAEVQKLPGRVKIHSGADYKAVGSGFGEDLANGLRSLPRVPELKVIDIRWSSLLPMYLDALDGFPALDEVHLMIYMTDAELPKLSRLPVRTLNLLISPVTDAGLKTIGTFRTLETLDISQCANVTWAGMVHLAMLDLTALDLSETKIDDAAVGSLAGMWRLRMLNVSRTRMTKAGVDELRRLLPECTITADDLRGADASATRR